MAEAMVILLVVCIFIVLLSGYPVALAYGGTALLFHFIGVEFFPETYSHQFMNTYDNNLYALISKREILMAVPLFIFMGVMLERSKVAENLLDTMGLLFGPVRGGLGISILLVGMLLAASTGIVGATVVTMGLLSLPTMLRRNYDPRIATGTICASGTLGQIIPPSIILILLGEQISTEYQNAQSSMNNFSPDTVSVGDLFAGALIPGLMLVGLYLMYLLIVAWLKPAAMPAIPKEERNLSGKQLMERALKVLIPPLLLILLVLGAIFTGAATAYEAASVGALGAMVLAIFNNNFNLEILREVIHSTMRITSMVFLIFIGAMMFTATFKGFGGHEIVKELLSDLPGGVFGAMFVIMLVMFLLGFILDFIEITLVVVPIVAPVIFMYGYDPGTGTQDPAHIINPVWFGIMIAINLQTSFLTPPFGFSLFYLRGVAPDTIRTGDIYKGVIPFILIQLLMLVILAMWPGLATWLADKV